MRKTFFILCIMAGLLFSSCEKLLIKPEEPKETDPRTNFEFLWKYIQERYPYFDEKKAHYGLDWDQVHEKYSAMIHDGMTQDEEFNVLAKMMNTLKDGHSNLSSPFKISFYDKEFLDTSNYNSGIIIRHYLMQDSSGTYNTKNGFAWAIQHDSIGYVLYSSFMNPVGQLDYILRSFRAAHVKGLILDIRNNGGGLVENAQLMAGRFVKERTYVGYNLARKAPGQFTEPLKQYIEPQNFYWDKPVVLLTSKISFSAANMVTEFLRPLDNVTTMGDSTGGGGALPYDYELPNGWFFRISEVPFYGINGNSIEEGIAPEVRVIQKPESTVEGRDDLIEQAIDRLK